MADLTKQNSYNATSSFNYGNNLFDSNLNIPSLLISDLNIYNLVGPYNNRTKDSFSSMYNDIYDWFPNSLNTNLLSYDTVNTKSQSSSQYANNIGIKTLKGPNFFRQTWQDKSNLNLTNLYKLPDFNVDITDSGLNAKLLTKLPDFKYDDSYNTYAKNQALKNNSNKLFDITSSAINTIGGIAKTLKKQTTINKNATGLKSTKALNIAGIGNQIVDFASPLIPNRSEYQGKYGKITETLDKTYDTVRQAAGVIPVVGPVVLFGLGAAGLLGKAMGFTGASTDGMTKADSILGSSFLSFTPLSWINGWGGRKTDSITKNRDAFSKVGASYTGSNSFIDNTLALANKKIGLLSGGALNKFNAQIGNARQQLNLISQIANTTEDIMDAKSGTSGFNNIRRNIALQGGYDQSAVTYGKQGMLLNKATDINLTEPIPEFQNGGAITKETTICLINPIEESIINLVEPIPEFQNGGAINVIPEGALHARKHNMEIKGITNKGIPVVSEKENGKIEQLAEIEKNEVILRLEVTEKLEEYKKKFKDTNDDKYALEAGKLLTYELLHNTDDRTNLIDNINN